MNRWSCDQVGCYETVDGFGGAIGLRAIGWYVKVPGPVLYCPLHRPDATLEWGRMHEGGPTIGRRPCSTCQAILEAHRWQQTLRLGPAAGAALRVHLGDDEAAAQAILGVLRDRGWRESQELPPVDTWPDDERLAVHTFGKQ